MTKTFTVYATYIQNYTITIEAENAKMAMEIAQEKGIEDFYQSGKEFTIDFAEIED